MTSWTASRKASFAGISSSSWKLFPGKIPVIRSLEVGINAIPSDASDDLILISEFDSAEDLSAYAVHPDHVKVAEVIARAKLTRNAVDYQV